MSETPEQHDETQRRAHARLSVGISARVETLEGNLPVRLIDLSQRGAHIVLLRTCEISRGVLSWLDFEAFGFVAWKDGDHIGLEFDEIVPLEELVETRNRAPSVVREESLSAEAAARDWAAGTLNLGLDR
jgi:hypothetical protein